MTTLSASDTIAAFLTPITRYKNIGILQQAMLKFSVTTGSPSVAAIRLISILFDLDLGAILLKSVTPTDFSAPTTAVLAAVRPVQDIVNNMNAYKDFVRLAIEEARPLLPPPTVVLLSDYSTDGSPIYRLGVAVLLVFAVNLQGH